MTQHFHTPLHTHKKHLKIIFFKHLWNRDFWWSQNTNSFWNMVFLLNKSTKILLYWPHNLAGADPCMVRIGTPPPPLWQINHAKSAYFRLFLGYFQIISATCPLPFGSRPPFLHILDPPLSEVLITVQLLIGLA